MGGLPKELKRGSIKHEK